MMSVSMGVNHFRFLSFNPQAGAKPTVLQGKRPYANNDMHSSPDDSTVGNSWTQESQMFGDVAIGELSRCQMLHYVHFMRVSRQVLEEALKIPTT